ncbi:MAG: hypothetical protein RML94_02445, partial [Bacteroidia bacterium]|nr:hypothetical protein [Bacteroidia bacterium]
MLRIGKIVLECLACNKYINFLILFFICVTQNPILGLKNNFIFGRVPLLRFGSACCGLRYRFGAS